MSKIWFTSDTHYHHKNIVRGVSEWKDTGESDIHSPQSTRPFQTLEEHDKALVDNINACCKEDDVLYHLGDWSFGGVEQVWEFRKRLICKNIHIIYGNHDHNIERRSVLLPNVHLVYTGDPVEEWKLVDGPLVRQTGSTVAMSAHNLFRSSQHYKEVTIEGHRIVLSHYSMRVWNKSHHGAWMLYGHSHGTLPEYSAVKGFPKNEYEKVKTMDVGVDTHPEFRPYSYEEIEAIMAKRRKLVIDHHNSKTN